MKYMHQIPGLTMMECGCKATLDRSLIEMAQMCYGRRGIRFDEIVEVEPCTRHKNCYEVWVREYGHLFLYDVTAEELSLAIAW